MDHRPLTADLEKAVKITLGKNKKTLPEGAKLVHDSTKLGTLNKGANKAKGKAKVSAHADLSFSQRRKQESNRK